MFDVLDVPGSARSSRRLFESKLWFLRPLPQTALPPNLVESLVIALDNNRSTISLLPCATAQPNSQQYFHLYLVHSHEMLSSHASHVLLLLNHHI